LNLRIAHDGGRFNGRHPRLTIKQVGGMREAVAVQGLWAFWGFVLVAIAGASAAFAGRLRYWNRSNPILAPPRPAAREYLFGDFRSRVRRPLVGLSSTGLITTVIFLVIWLSNLVLYGMANPVPVIVGLPVHLWPALPAAAAGPGIQPLVVRLRVNPPERRPALYLDAQPISWADLESVLRKELRLRPPTWPVYIDGDPNMEVGWAFTAIDIIRGLGGEATLLPKSAATTRQ
jgi:hypothetical protein